MKVNAPEKIYIPTILAANTVRYKEEDSIEYVRTDVFIEKACFYIKNMVLDMTYLDVDGKESYKIDEFIEDFKKYLEGE